jgi:hypothetical protein
MKSVRLLREALVDKIHHPPGTVLLVGDGRAEAMVENGMAELTRHQPPKPAPAPKDPVIAALRPGKRTASIIAGRAG